MGDYIYTNWRGKSFDVHEILDELIANHPELAYMTPESLMESIAMFEEVERFKQLEEMWENPEAKTNR
ncbi:hypothetical protein DNFV4_04328 [Nitrospira tepida]|uniref:Uncharacterized protein n=1 Tax=Nitrospira tepida TaxID=2973512 RepID=A0AA86T903_9BACT|nr:hypothetical protein [Nitrospira tepida]CAI4033886.1 hypothetical protein DNFV4_04328 [Nitrospira tepida]